MRCGLSRVNVFQMRQLTCPPSKNPDIANWPAEDIFVVFGSTNRLSCASPGLSVRGKPWTSVQGQTRVNAPVYRFGALALVAGRPIPFPPPLSCQSQKGPKNIEFYK